ncbi:MAG: hypothetical protein ACOYJY_00430 [Acutalibacteraceae bacterium]|jgi:hypothetical protein
MTRFVKSLTYTGAAALTTILSALIQSGLRADGGPEAGYYAAHRWLLLTAVVLFGGGVYLFLFHRRDGLRPDGVMLAATGAGLLIATVALWIGYGGLAEPFDETGYRAVNLQIALLTAAPLPFWVRGLALGLSHEIEPPARRRIAWGSAAAVGALFAGLIAAGALLRMMYVSP